MVQTHPIFPKVFEFKLLLFGELLAGRGASRSFFVVGIQLCFCFFILFRNVFCLFLLNAQQGFQVLASLIDDEPQSISRLIVLL